MSTQSYMRQSSSDELSASSSSNNRSHYGKPFASLRAPLYLLALILVGFLALPISHPASRAIIHARLSWPYRLQHISLSDDLADHPKTPLPLTLEARLSHYLLDRPALSHHQAILSNHYGCPMGTYSRDDHDHHRAMTDIWSSITSDHVVQYRSALVDYLHEQEINGIDVVWETGTDDDVPPHLRRGIVMSAGDSESLQRALVSHQVLRNVLHSTIPVEVYHFTDELTDEDLGAMSLEYDITFVAIGPKNGGTEKTRSMLVFVRADQDIKNIALLTTKFTEVMWLEGLPLINPTELFASVEYTQSGSVFWPDRYKDHPDNAIWRILGRDCSDDDWPAAAAQIIFDKRANNGLNLAVLHIANHMTIRDDLYGNLADGDKDTFRYAFYALGLPFQQAPRASSVAGGYQNDDSNFCGEAIFHWALTPLGFESDRNYQHTPAFLHATLKDQSGQQTQAPLTHVRHARLDHVHERTLHRVRFTLDGQCFNIDLQGPDGSLDVKDSLGDGQGVVTDPITDVVGDGIWTAILDVEENWR